MIKLIPILLCIGFVASCSSPENPPTPAVPVPQAVDSTTLAQTEHSGSPLFTDLADSWNTISPGGDTMCVYGTPYSFFARPADPSKLLISFPGGGACWSGLTCTDEPVGRMDDNPKTVRAEDNPAGSAGIMSEDNPENPFQDYTKILVGYCTGDMHIGDAEMPNDGPLESGQTRTSDTLHFNGYTNAMTVLEWVFENFESPDSVVVSGHTSGSYGTPFYTSFVADRYPNAAVRHLGDGNGALYLGEFLQPIRDAWGTVELLNGHDGFEGLDPDTFSFEDITIRAAQRHPEIVFTQLITAHDAVLSEMIEYLGFEEPILTAVEAGHAYVKSQAPNYRTFLAGGNKHVIALGYFDSIPQTGNRNRGLPDIYDRFYSYQVDGRRYRDWIADMVDGQPIEDIRCSDCQAMDHYSP